MLLINPIPAFTDNYFWAISVNNKAIIVDPGDAKTVIDYLSAQQLTLAAILITHWHHDHIGGVETLVKKFNVPVYGPNTINIPQVTHAVYDSQTIQILNIEFTVLAVPGHTLDHIAFYANTHRALFCGDTLFAGGCGRLFEGTPAMMLASLDKLANLPSDTFFYCAHEYTLSNLRFALAVEPENKQLQQRFIDCEKQREQQLCTLPSTIGLEKLTNPFLRVREASVISQALHQGAVSDSDLDVFTCIRTWKNNF